VLRRPIALILVLAASATVCVSLAYGGVPPEVKQFQQACSAAATSIRQVMAHSATAQVRVITAPLTLPAPGTVTGHIALNPSGSTIHVAGDTSQVESVGCATATVVPGVNHRRGHSLIVSDLRQTFATAGRHTLTFALDATGRRILARLGAKQRAYRMRHPNGRRLPTISFGVALTYRVSG
jgi:hypothetical protein